MATVAASCALWNRERTANMTPNSCRDISKALHQAVSPLACKNASALLWRMCTLVLFPHFSPAYQPTRIDLFHCFTVCRFSYASQARLVVGSKVRLQLQPTFTSDPSKSISLCTSSQHTCNGTPLIHTLKNVLDSDRGVVFPAFVMWQLWKHRLFTLHFNEQTGMH